MSHPHVIQSPIENDYITFKFDDVYEGVNTELRQKVLLQVSVRELPINMLKIYDTRFSMGCDEKVLVRISDSDL